MGVRSEGFKIDIQGFGGFEMKRRVFEFRERGSLEVSGGRLKSKVVKCLLHLKLLKWKIERFCIEI
jgi:hypothetical protein